MIKEIKQGGFSLKIYKTRLQAGEAAGKAAAEKINLIIAEKGEANVIFAAAPSQNQTLAALVGQNVDFSKIRAFHMDEYIGLPEGSKKLFSQYLDDNIFKKVNFKEIYYIGTGDSQAVILRYTKLIKTYPPDVVILGIGENGHIAFNDPHVADFNDTQAVKVVTLDEKCRIQQVNDKTFDSLADVPTHAVTLTIPTLTSAKYLICTVPGDTKAWAVERTLNAKISKEVPSTAMRLHGSAEVFADENSAGLILQNGR